jgi:hypothetical protein
VVDGAAHYRELTRMTREKVHKLLLKRNLKRPRRTPGSEELVGTRFSDASVEEMKALSLRGEDLAEGMDIRQILSADFAASGPPGALAHGAARLEVFAESFWYQSTRVTKAITNREILDGICASLGAADR